MKWIVTIETTEEGHQHIDVPDPDAAAVTLNEINDRRAEAGLSPAHARIESYNEFWECTACDQERGDTYKGDTLATSTTTHSWTVR